MPRPPKKINPAAHRSTGAYRKGRFATSPVSPDESAISEIAPGDDPTATVNASFATVDDRRIDAAPTDAPHRLGEPRVRSKYDARPSAGAARTLGDGDDDGLVVDLTAPSPGEAVVIDLTKLPPVDVSRRSSSVYVRHSDRWPTTEGRRESPEA